MLLALGAALAPGDAFAQKHFQPSNFRMRIGELPAAASRSWQPMNSLKVGQASRQQNSITRSDPQWLYISIRRY